MNPNTEKQTWATLCFLLPFLLYITSTPFNTLAFADAAEFSLVSFLGSIAHPPGTPSYVLLSWLWTKLLSPFSLGDIFINKIFTVFSSSFACVFLYLTLVEIIRSLKINTLSERTIFRISALGSILFATWSTTWYWSNTVEVYAFQNLALSIFWFGLFNFYFHKKTFYLWLASLGGGLAMANHYFSFVLFVPFIPLFFIPDVFSGTQPNSITPKNKKIPVRKKENLLTLYFKSLFSRSLLTFGVTTLGIGFLFYGWMYYRAHEIFPFEFGNPDTLSRWWFHFTGGPYMKAFDGAKLAKNIFSLNTPYFFWIFVHQFELFIPWLLLGTGFLFFNKKFVLPVFCFLYLGIILFIVLRSKNSTGDGDAYLLPGLYLLSIITGVGLAYTSVKKLFFWLVWLLLPFQIILNRTRADRFGFNVSESIMHHLDVSAPKNSIVLIADWTTVMQYYYYRVAENFRPDLVVLNYDIKFTNYQMIRELYPEFYKKFEKTYMNFIHGLSAEHPQQIFNTGCDLSTPLLTKLFSDMIIRLKE